MKAKKKNLLIYGLVAALFLELFIIPAPEVQAGGDGVLKNGGKITLVNTARDRKQGYWLSLSGIPENDSWENYKVKVTSSQNSEF